MFNMKRALKKAYEASLSGQFFTNHNSVKFGVVSTRLQGSFSPFRRTQLWFFCVLNVYTSRLNDAFLKIILRREKIGCVDKKFLRQQIDSSFVE